VFFRNADALFTTLEVPADLKGVLIRPFLNERSKALVARLDDSEAANYDEIKSLILQENKITPATYRDKFNLERKEESETYMMFTSRLRTWLTSYTESRGVTNLQDLQELLLCDRVKTVLNPETLKYVLSIEAADNEGWLRPKKLAESIDNYIANQIGERPRSFGTNSGSQYANKNRNFQHSKAPGGLSPASSEAVHTTGNVSQATAAKSKACFKCGSLSHFKADCPLLKRGNAPLGSAGTRGEGNQTRRVFNCTTEGAPIAASGNNMGNASKGTSEVDSRGQVPSNPSTGGRSNAVAASQLTSCKSVVNDVTITPSMGVEACEIARLNYINVGIASHDNSSNYLSVSALEDSGSRSSKYKFN